MRSLGSLKELQDTKGLIPAAGYRLGLLDAVWQEAEGEKEVRLQYKEMRLLRLWCSGKRQGHCWVTPSASSFGSLCPAAFLPHNSDRLPSLQAGS